jgi:hypothetical protein
MVEDEAPAPAPPSCMQCKASSGPLSAAAFILTARSRALTSSRSRVREDGRSAAGAGEALGVPAGPRAGVVEIGETAAAKRWRSKSPSLDELDRKKKIYMCIVCFRG